MGELSCGMRVTLRRIRQGGRCARGKTGKGGLHVECGFFLPRVREGATEGRARLNHGVEVALSGEVDRYREEVRGLVAEVLQLPLGQVHDGLSFGDVAEWDSLGHMDLLMALEERYGVPLDEERITRLISIDAICRELAGTQHA